MLPDSEVLKSFLRYSTLTVEVYKTLAVNLVLNPPPISIAVNKLYSCRWLNYILISCAMTQKYKVFHLKNVIRASILSTKTGTSNF